MTSNIGAKYITEKKTLGCESNSSNWNKSNNTEYNGAIKNHEISEREKIEYEETKKEVMKELKKELRPEFINRIDEIIVFHKLNDEEIRQIAQIMLKQVEKRLKEQKILVEIDKSVTEMLVEKGVDKNFGARPLRRTIQNLVEDQIADEILNERLQKNKLSKIIAINGKIEIA